MAYRAEALTPCYGSLLSADIPESYYFSWDFRPLGSDKQGKAEIKIYQKGTSTVLKSYTVTGETNRVAASSIGYAFVDETEYDWSVLVYVNGAPLEESLRATFRVGKSPARPDITWDSGPEAYEYIGSKKYFDLFKRNGQTILADYAPDTDLNNRVSSELFVGDVVPSRTDFELLEEVLRMIAFKEYTMASRIMDLIEDGLGAEDMHKIYDIFDELTRIPPQPAKEVQLIINTSNMYQIQSLTAKNDNKEDNTVDLSWRVDPMESSYGDVYIVDPYRSEDVRYFVCTLEYGPSTYPYRQQFYLRLEDMKRIKAHIRFTLDYSGLFRNSSLSKAREYFSVMAVDGRGNASNREDKEILHGPNFKVPIGLSHYELWVEKNPLWANSPNNGTWQWLANVPAALSYTHTVPWNAEGKYFYSIRAVDTSGLTSEWLYSNGILFDPLRPPDPPTNLRLIYSDTGALQFQWDRGARSEGHNVSFPTDNYSGGPTSDDKWWKGGLAEGSWTEIRVQAYNRAGTSSWIGMWAQTKTRPPTWSPEKPLWCECWRTAYTINGGRSWNKADWRVESWDNARFECIQGMWIELRTGYNTDGRWVQKGTTYGNHKSLIFTDRNYWKNLLAGKEILEVQLYMKRKSTSNGYPNDGRWLHFWTHNYDGVPWGQEPWLGNPRTVWENFARGEEKWINLPIEYGHMLQRGEIGGFALHSDFRYADSPDKYTYLRFDENMRLRVKYK